MCNIDKEENVDINKALESANETLLKSQTLVEKYRLFIEEIKKALGTFGE